MDRLMLIQNAPEIFGRGNKASLLLGSYINAVKKMCPRCRDPFKGNVSSHLIFCKWCAYTECYECSMSYFEESPKLTNCPSCQELDWPYKGDEADAQRFFICLWKEMAKDITSFERNLSKQKPITTLRKIVEQIGNASTVGMDLN